MAGPVPDPPGAGRVASLVQARAGTGQGDKGSAGEGAGALLPSGWADRGTGGVGAEDRMHRRRGLVGGGLRRLQPAGRQLPGAPLAHTPRRPRPLHRTGNKASRYHHDGSGILYKLTLNFSSFLRFSVFYRTRYFKI